MNCRGYQRALISKVGSEPAEPAEPAEKAELTRHHASCSACRSFAQRFEGAKDLLARPAAIEGAHRPPSGFAVSVVAALPERRSPLAWASLRLLPVTTALALTLLAWCWLATPSPGELWTQAGEDEVLAWVSRDGG